MNHLMLATFVALALFSPAGEALAVDPTLKCESGKLKEAAKYAACRLKVEAKAVSTATTPDFSTCAAKFTPKFTGLETKAGAGICPSEGDEPDINARIVDDTTDLAVLLGGETCASLGHIYDGTLDCVPAACTFDESGCQAKVVFVTSLAFDGILGGLAGADTKCAARATAAGLTGTFKAWLGSGSSGPSTTFTQASIPYVRVDGVVVANNWADLTDGTLDATISVTEAGAAVGGDAWTNVQTDGDPNGASDCSNWGDDNFLNTGNVGNPGSTTSTWTANSFGTCNNSKRLYCVEQ
jgi:hypothetical protein